MCYLKPKRKYFPIIFWNYDNINTVVKISQKGLIQWPMVEIGDAKKSVSLISFCEVCGSREVTVEAIHEDIRGGINLKKFY